MQHLIVPFPDFRLGDIIDPDQFDENNQFVEMKINEVIDVINELIGENSLSNLSGARLITVNPTAPFTARNLQALMDELINRITSTQTGSSGSSLIGTPALVKLAGINVEEQLKALDNLLQTAYVVNSSIANGAITTEKLSNLSVTTEKINDGAVTEQKIANQAVTTQKIANQAINSQKLQNGAVTSNKIMNSAIGAQHLQSYLLNNLPQNALSALLQEHTQNNTDMKHIDYVGTIPTDLSGLGFIVKTDGTHPDTPGRASVDDLIEEVDALNSNYGQFVSDVNDELLNYKNLIKPYSYLNHGVAFDSNDPTLPVRDTHASWTHGTVSYDKTTNKVVFFYNLKPVHSNDNIRVLMRTKEPNGSFSQPIVVADKISSSVSCKTQSAGITPNGDYIVHVWEKGTSETNGSVYQYRSTDKGITWTRNSTPITSGSDINGILVLKSGRILIHQDFPSKVLYSDDNGVTWDSANPFPGLAIVEPAWCELSDGTIVAYYRRNTDYTGSYPAYFTKSTDGGVNWTVPIVSSSILDFTNSNGHLIYHENSKTVEFIHHSRYTQPDGYSSLYVSVAHESEVKNDNFGSQVRIDKLSPQGKPVYGSTGDSGYIGATKDGQGTIHAFYYNGTANNSQICYLTAKQAVEHSEPISLDYYTGEPIVPGTMLNSVLQPSDFEQGGINIGIGSMDTLNNNASRLRTKKHYLISGGSFYKFDLKNPNYYFSIRQYDENYINISDSGLSLTGSVTFKTSPNARYLRFLIRKLSDATIIPSDVLNLLHTDAISFDKVVGSLRSDEWISFTKTSPQSIANAFASSNVTFDSSTAYHGANFATIDPSTGRIKITKPGVGLYEIHATISYATNSTGHRSFSVGFSTSTQMATPGTSTDISLTSMFEAQKDTFVNISASQTSGAPLNILSCTVRIRKIASVNNI